MANLDLVYEIVPPGSVFVTKMAPDYNFEWVFIKVTDREWVFSLLDADFSNVESMIRVEILTKGHAKVNKIIDYIFPNGYKLPKLLEILYL